MMAAVRLLRAWRVAPPRALAPPLRRHPQRRIVELFSNGSVARGAVVARFAGATSVSTRRRLLASGSTSRASLRIGVHTAGPVERRERIPVYQYRGRFWRIFSWLYLFVALPAFTLLFLSHLVQGGVVELPGAEAFVGRLKSRFRKREGTKDEAKASPILPRQDMRVLLLGEAVLMALLCVQAAVMVRFTRSLVHSIHFLPKRKVEIRTLGAVRGKTYLVDRDLLLPGVGEFGENAGLLRFTVLRGEGKRPQLFRIFHRNSSLADVTSSERLRRLLTFNSIDDERLLSAGAEIRRSP